MALTLGQYEGNNIVGFTDFGDLAALGYSIYYVASSASVVSPVGSSSGTGSSASPINTPANAMAASGLGSGGYSQVAVAILLRMGDRWESASFGGLAKSGTFGSFNGTKWSDSTTYSGKPMIFGSYDPDLAVSSYGVNPYQSTRSHPLLTSDGNNCWLAIGVPSSQSGDCIAIVGIDIYASYHDPQNSTAIPAYSSALDNTAAGSFYSMGNPTSFVLIEDCNWSYCANQIVAWPSGVTTANCIVRRSKIRNAWLSSGGTRSGGFGAMENGVNPLFEENVFDQCGWNEFKNQPEAADIRGQNHSYYVGTATGAIIRGNIICRNPDGLPFRANNNLMFDNFHTDCQVNHHDLAPGCLIQDNVYSRGQATTATIGGGARSQGINIIASITAQSECTYDRNIFSNAVTGADAAISHGDGQNGTFSRNIFYNWSSNANTNSDLYANDFAVSPERPPNGRAAYTFDTIVTNVFGSSGVSSPLAPTGGTGERLLLEAISCTGGSVISVTPWINPTGNMRRYPGQLYTVGDILTAATTTGSSFTCRVATVSSNLGFSSATLPNYSFYGGAWLSTGYWGGSLSSVTGYDPTRTALTYMALTGHTTTVDGFVATVSANTRQTWVSSLSGPDINDYIRAGFGITSSSTAGSTTAPSPPGSGAAPSFGFQSGRVKGPRRKMPHAGITDPSEVWPLRKTG